MLEKRITTGGDPGPLTRSSSGPRTALEWAGVLAVLAATACLSLMVSRLSTSPVFAWLPLGVGAAFVLRYGRWLTIPVGIVTAASGAWLLGSPDGSDWSTTPDIDAMIPGSIGLGIATIIGLLGLHAVMGTAALRITHGLVNLADAGRLIILGMPVPIITTTIAWSLTDVENGDPGVWTGFAASMMLGMLAGLPLAISLLPGENGPLTYRCRAERVIRVAPGMLVLVLTVIASWWMPADLEQAYRVLFISLIIGAFLWLAIHSGWFSTSVAAFVASFINAPDVLGGQTGDALAGFLILIPLLCFVILVTACMEQRFRDLSHMNDQYEELQALLQATGAAFLQVDLDGRILSRNDIARRILDSIDESEGGPEKFEHAFDDRSRRRIRAATRVALSGRRRECEVSIRRDGGLRSMHLAVFSPSLEAKGRIRGCSIVLLNLATTHRRELIRLRRREREFGLLAGALVHDVNNFAMAVGGAVSLARENRSEGMSDMLSGIEDTCLETARRAQRIRHAVPTSDQGRLVDLGTVTGERLRRHQRQGRIGIAAITCDPETIVDVPESFAEFIVDEFIENSREAMGGERPEIALNCRRTEAQEVEMRIGDNGPGIPEAIRMRIGSSFVTTRGGGRGLGLRAITTGVRSAGGRMRINSSPAGTVLRITLPLIESRERESVVVVSSPRDLLQVVG